MRVRHGITNANGTRGQETALAFEIRNTQRVWKWAPFTVSRPRFKPTRIPYKSSNRTWNTSRDIDGLFSAMKRTGNFQGYAPLLDCNIDPSNRGDLLEGFAAGWEELVPAKHTLNYYHAGLAVGKVLYRLFALSLDLPETVLPSYGKNPASKLFRSSTLRQWINVTPIPGTLVVNIADQLGRWTNNLFRSPVHRAVNWSGIDAMFFGGSKSDV
ncbi:hypothetical protein SCLCIDRAFT_23191 [Scleroderma citrinum Foug A]|uniref:Isopenicillin N synthase-like Fe(2+) 2OG dioxygenase domain-containing protein n=1 Tax=Scleroderma citrinum Foug A TaxID=1036808 RepID=A0A0C3E9V5_9AGAM|nr:hypothetical protein SCLCIDRAFT_23191 [Scleroderma citrinum Foug A]